MPEVVLDLSFDCGMNNPKIPGPSLGPLRVSVTDSKTFDS